MNVDPRRAAQDRVNRVALFREELAELEREGALRLTLEQRAGLEEHLQRITAALAQTYGIDATDSARRLSWGMRLTALLGGAAIFAALVLLLHRVWGFLPAAGQVALLTATPLGFLAGAAWSSRRALDPFFTSLLALAAGVAFVMGLSANGAIHNQSGSPQPILGWAAFALLTAYALRLRILLAAGLLLACGYVSALGLALTGGWWGSLIEKPMFMIPAAAGVYFVPSFWRQPDQHRFGVVFRSCGAGAGLGALLLFSLAGHLCCFGLSFPVAETLSQLAGLALAAAVIYHALRLGEGPVANLGALAFVTFLFARLHAWCWDWMPKYAFFFMLGCIAVVLLVIFRRLRLRPSERGLP